MQNQIYARWNKIVAALILTGTLVANAQATPLRFQSGAKPVPLLELYTSEGCSSCPAAEAWLGRLKDSPGLWRDFSPIALHVHYWDSPSWRDHWSAPEYTERQRSYAEAWHAANIYTPCFVLQGKEWSDWVLHRSVPATTGEDIGVLDCRRRAPGGLNQAITTRKPQLSVIVLGRIVTPGFAPADGRPHRCTSRPGMSRACRRHPRPGWCAT